MLPCRFTNDSMGASNMRREAVACAPNLANDPNVDPRQRRVPDARNDSEFRTRRDTVTPT